MVRGGYTEHSAGRPGAWRAPCKRVLHPLPPDGHMHYYLGVHSLPRKTEKLLQDWFFNRSVAGSPELLGFSINPLGRHICVRLSRAKIIVPRYDFRNQGHCSINKTLFIFPSRMGYGSSCPSDHCTVPQCCKTHTNIVAPEELVSYTVNEVKACMEKYISTPWYPS